MDRLIRSYLEGAVTNGESWDSDEDPNDVITAQDLLGYFDALVKRDAEARADTERLDKLARFLLDNGDFFEYREIDHFDAEDVLKDAGLIEDSVVNADDCENGWPAEWDLSEGDGCLRISPRGRQAISAMEEPE